MLTKLAEPLKRALNEAKRNSDGDGYFVSYQCLSESGESLNEQFFIELERQKYIRSVADGGLYQLLSKALTYDEDEAEYERQLASNSNNTAIFYGSAEKVLVQQGTHNSRQTMKIEQSTDTEELFRSIFAVLQDSTVENQGAIEVAISEMRQAVGQPSFGEKYKTFIQSIANHMTIFAPFIPQLTALLPS